MTVMHIDIETYSSYDIRKTGAYRYTEAPDFEILIIAFSIDGGEVRAIDMYDKDDKRYKQFKWHLLDPEVEKRAFNANFERVCLAKHFNTTMPADEWVCDMVDATRVGLPASLEKCAEVLEVEAQKDKSGKALIRYFSVPCKPTKVNGGRTRNLPEHDTEKWEQFISYCVKDVEAEMAIGDEIADFEVLPSEQLLWTIDQHINDRGVHIDEQLMLGAYELDKISKSSLQEQAKRLTGLDNPNSQQQLVGWFNEQGVELDNLRKATVDEYLEKTTGRAHKMLELRQQMSKTSVKKYDKMYNMACNDNRIRGMFQFYGAGTGRWAGRGVQMQNLTKHKMTDEELDIAREAIKKQDFEWLDLMLDYEYQDILSQLVRTTFTAQDGYKLAVSDFSAIEARVIAWLAGEQWRLDVFDTHGKIYEASASQMFGVPVESIGKGDPLRQKGKVAELALGYQGGAGALKSMGALDMGIEEDELKPLVDSWRKANPNIKKFWYNCQKSAIGVLEDGEPRYTNGLKFYLKQKHLLIELSSGRTLVYRNAELANNSWGATVIAFRGLDLNRKWTTVKTYGGKLVENIVQATARDALGVSMERLEAEGYKIVAHVHDEIILEVPDDGHDHLKDIEDIMSQPVVWADGLNLDSDGFVSPFYMKD
ncbi:DNA polymerase [Staphylococcus sp. 18_1_E_LY]|uniref:DNA-directed DNA polymerase n=1 Tax=Staphylococcus lloydii TaxID=2781774 RepID=A0A7T1B020_9STAP|nr:DNA polymerase [Staphylococcus lloydii]MBF7019646.1 DNA polymerase [Staphylococcus lloydii]MBF7027374.1 DNA polymerase [Staphylococcus lloydii]QPM75036.1 DNA polymerase [Staphylococcus lloydii]